MSVDGTKSGGFFQGVMGQSRRNIVLEPIFGANTASADPGVRRGEKAADVAFILGGGGAVVGGAKLIRHHRSVLGTVAGAAIGLVGAAGAAAGAVNLLDGSAPKGPKPPHKPDKPDKPNKPDKPDNPENPDKPDKPDPEKPDKPDRPDKPNKPDAPDKPRSKVHTVRRGEYLSHIGECVDRTWQQMYWANRETIGSNPDHLRAGQKLRVPSKDYKVPAFLYEPTYVPGVVPDDLDCYKVTREPPSKKG